MDEVLTVNGFLVPGVGWVWLDWIVGLVLVLAAFLEFVMNRDPEVKKNHVVIAARWVRFSGLLALGGRYIFVLTSTPQKDMYVPLVTNLAILGVALGTVLLTFLNWKDSHR